MTNPNLTLNDLREILEGDAAVISTREKLTTAVEGETVYPQTIKDGAYVMQTRADEDGNAVSAVSLCSKGQFLNEVERVFASLRAKNVEPLTKANAMEVTYPVGIGRDSGSFFDYDLPGRAADLHFQAGTTINGALVLDDPYYIDALKFSDNTSKLLGLSVISSVLGLWDSRRPSGVKVPSALRGEVYGVCSTQTRDPDTGKFITDSNRSGAGWRKDPFQPGYDPSVVTKVKATIGKDKFTDKVETNAKTAAELGIGNAPADGNGGVAVRDIVRYSVISIPLVRSIKVSDDDAENLKAQTVILAFLVSLAAMSRKVSHYRAGCDLVRVSGVTRVDADTTVATPSVEDGLNLLREALADAGDVAAGFDGNVYSVIGNPDIQKAAKDDAEEAK